MASKSEFECHLYNLSPPISKEQAKLEWNANPSPLPQWDKPCSCSTTCEEELINFNTKYYNSLPSAKVPPPIEHHCLDSKTCLLCNPSPRPINTRWITLCSDCGKLEKPSDIVFDKTFLCCRKYCKKCKMPE